MLKLKKFTLQDYSDYQSLYDEFLANNSDLVPDVLELKCQNIADYKDILKELENRLYGNHQDIDWYQNGYYYLVYDNICLVGLACIRTNLTKLGSDIWGNIAIGVRPSKRKMGYATNILKNILAECKNLGMPKAVVCHYVTNEITPKILKKVNATYTNSVISEYTGKEIKRYIIKL